MPDRAQIFRDCGKILLRIHAQDENEDHFTEIVIAARKCALELTRELVQSCEDDVRAGVTGHVLSVLSDLHPEAKYGSNGGKAGTLIVEKLVRDLADICATFRSIELGVERSSREKLLEAKLFCSLMADEFLKMGQ